MTGAAAKPARWRCHLCGETFTAWAAAQRHGDQPGHGRIEFVLPPANGETA